MSFEPDLPFAALFEQSPIRGAIFEAGARYVAANHAYRSTTGCAWDELRARTTHAAFDDATAVEVLRSIEQVLVTGQPDAVAGGRSRLEQPGARTWAIAHTPLRAPSGEVRWVLQHLADVTEHESESSTSPRVADVVQRSPEALEVREREHRLLAEMLPTQAWTASPDGAITWVNRATSEYRGMPADALLGDAMWRGAVHPDDLEEAGALWARALETGTTYEHEARLLRHDGVFRWHMTRAVAWRDATGAVSKWFGSTTDVDEHRRIEAHRVQLIGQLRARNFDLQRFAYAVSHDVKAPLRAISNLATWVADDLGSSATPEIATNLELMRSRAQELSQRLDGMLKDAVSGRAAGQPSDTEALVSEAVTLLAHVTSARVYVDESPPSVASAPGIEQGRGDVSDGTAPMAGTGIGLSVVRRIVEANGGSVAIDTTPGGGATISFTWPRVR
ncbi:MAG: PAS domain S-box protein [Deltaproteobacteria bacterium]|nr:PAS domain S-box protein [Deltaproteobacteria bacterium]